MLKRLAWLCRAPAVIFAAALLLAGVYFGSTRDFLAFLVSIPTLGILFLVALAATIWASRGKAERGRVVVAYVLIGLTPLVYFSAYGTAQTIRFLFWAPAHLQQLEQASRKDGIVTGWDSWGFGGEDTFSYLVVDTQDRLGSKARADEWTKAIGQSCDLWQTQRMWPKLYVVTTDTNCPYDGVEPAG